MHEILPLTFWIGNARDARDAALILDTGIAAVVDVAYEERPAELPRELVYCRIPLIDGWHNDVARLQLAVDTVRSLLEAQTPTLLACSAGMSRAPAIAAAALARHLDEPADATLARIAQSGPHDVSPTLWDSLIALGTDG